jgi:hypothetical protein
LSGGTAIGIATLLNGISAHRRRLTVRERKRFCLEVGRLEQRALLADLTAPTTVVASEIGTHGANGWFVSPVTVNFSATDPDNTPAQLTTFFRVNGGAQQTGTRLTLANNGIFTVTYHSQDPAGNAENTHTLVVMIDRTAPVVTINASPNILWPPNHKLVPVTVSGSVFDATSGPVGSVHFQVVDEYGQVAPHGNASLGPNHTYSFVVMLPASRLGQDKDGRTLTIFVTAADNAGNRTTVHTVVLVPHDMGHPFNLTGGVSRGAGSGGGSQHGRGHGHKGGNTIVMPAPVYNPGPIDEGGDNGGGGNSHGHGHGNANKNGHGHGG